MHGHTCSYPFAGNILLWTIDCAFFSCNLPKMVITQTCIVYNSIYAYLHHAHATIYLVYCIRKVSWEKFHSCIIQNAMCQNFHIYDVMFYTSNFLSYHINVKSFMVFKTFEN